jgi:hypothetical protein
MHYVRNISIEQVITLVAKRFAARLEDCKPSVGIDVTDTDTGACVRIARNDLNAKTMASLMEYMDFIVSTYNSYDWPAERDSLGWRKRGELLGSTITPITILSPPEEKDLISGPVIVLTIRDRVDGCVEHKLFKIPQKEGTSLSDVDKHLDCVSSALHLLAQISRKTI